MLWELSALGAYILKVIDRELTRGCVRVLCHDLTGSSVDTECTCS